MKIYVLGYKGMLGRYVYTYLKSKEYDVVGFSRDEFDASSFEYNEEHLSEDLFMKGIKPEDVIINCIGVIKPMVDKHGTLNAIKINSIFPHVLANVCEKNNYKLLHITTDCCYSCNDNIKNEESDHDCTDVYGKTKSLGEPENCTVIRSSIIGEEINQGRSLIEWIKSKKDDKANGFINHKWNGVTCLQMSKIFEEIINKNLYWKGVRHIFSPNTVNKYDLVNMVSEIYDLNIDVIPTQSKESCDRSLSSIHNVGFNIPDIETQIIEMYEFRKKLIKKI